MTIFLGILFLCILFWFYLFFLVIANWDLPSILFLVIISMWNYFCWTLGMDSDFRKPFPISELLFSWIKHSITWWLHSELPCLFAPSADSTQSSFSPCPGTYMLRTYSLLFALTLLARLPETSSILLVEWYLPLPEHISWLSPCFKSIPISRDAVCS